MSPPTVAIHHDGDQGMSGIGTGIADMLEPQPLHLAASVPGNESEICDQFSAKKNKK